MACYLLRNARLAAKHASYCACAKTKYFLTVRANPIHVDVINRAARSMYLRTCTSVSFTNTTGQTVLYPHTYYMLAATT